ncbi:hypothetical protein STRIC_1201 [Streptococcus ictaluri 707-05]|uniref:Uncharacterized protein n=1 Tax=Streptococcus ictaluri 707-05 TaxID=764299 RepID=G5K333_9STRE|nr:hypothetical protein STRIC_1201 [Streptococcus ictaluri 707-05]
MLVSSKPESEDGVTVPSSTEPLVDFHFPEDLTDFYPKTTREKIETNVAAIRLVKSLDQSGRFPTLEEQDLLAKYVVRWLGWLSQ